MTAVTILQTPYGRGWRGEDDRFIKLEWGARGYIREEDTAVIERVHRTRLQHVAISGLLHVSVTLCTLMFCYVADASCAPSRNDIFACMVPSHWVWSPSEVEFGMQVRPIFTYAYVILLSSHLALQLVYRSCWLSVHNAWDAMWFVCNIPYQMIKL